MPMKRSLFILLLAAWAITPAKAQDQTYADCLVKASSSWGQPCDKCEDYKGFKRDYSGVYQVVLKNACTEMMEVKVAMEEADGHWRTFPVKTLEGGATMTAYACHGTGKYMYWARRVNDTEIILPSDREIVSTYPAN
jgi:hypothetical protein